MEKNLILTKAKGAVLSHDFATAARLYKMLLSEDASNVEYLKQLGSIYVQNQEDEKAIPYYEQIITFYPHYIEAMNSLGAIYRRLGRYEESISILQRAVDEGRDSASVNYNLGFTYKEMGNYKDAIDAFNLVVHENPDDVLAYNHLGRIYFAQQNYDKAIASYKRGLQIDQNHPILNYNLAHCYEATKNTSDAIRCYQAALKTRPGWVDAINDFSELLISCQKNKEAQDLVQQSIKLHPTNGDLLRLLGKVYLNQYDYASAEKTFWKADAYKSNDVKILTGLSEALEKGEKVDAALDTVLSALEIEPENKDIRKQYVHTLLTAKDYDAALANVTDLYDETEGKDLGVLDLYGQYYICQNDEEKAQEYYNKIIRQNHHYKDYMLGAAERFSQIGNHDKAESYAKDYIDRRPGNPEGYNVLGKVFENKGDLHKAIESYNKSLTLRTPNVMADKKIAAFKDQIIKNEAIVEETPVPQMPVDEPVVNETPVVEVEEEKANDEEFDYSLMGGNVPLQEGLVEEEKDFFDTLDEENDELPEEEEQKSDKTDEEETPKFKYNNNDPRDVFGDDGIFDDEASKKANNTLENGLKDAIDDLNNSPEANSIPTEDDSSNPDFGNSGSSAADEELSNSLTDAADDEDDFDIFGNDPLTSKDEPVPENKPEQKSSTPAPSAPVEPEDDYKPYEEPSAPQQFQPQQQPQPQTPIQPQPQAPYYPQQEELERRMQQIAMDNAAHAMEAAYTAQKMAQQLADQQKLMQEQTQQALQDAVDKMQNMQEERIKEQDRALDSLLDDNNIQDETPVVEETEPEVPEANIFEETASEEPETNIFEETASEEPETNIFEETAPEEPEADVFEETAPEEPEADVFEETAPEEPETDIFEETASEEPEADIFEEVTPEESFTESEVPDDGFNLDLGDDFSTDEDKFEETEITEDDMDEFKSDFDSSEEQDILNEELMLDGTEEEAEEIIFGSTDDLLQQLGEGEDIFVEEEYTPEINSEIIREEIQEEPFDEENDFVEERFNYDDDISIDVNPEMDADDMLAKIERILSDDDMAKEYGPQLELFKKLKILSDYLPESEKNSFLSCRMRMLIEYIISKMSGKPGLLSTATALLKSGVLGDEYNNRVEDDADSDGEVRNELIRTVLLDMKKMTQHLQDRTLANAMIASVDNILERIELEDQKSKIF